MTAETARLLSGAPSSKAAREEPLDKSYDDEMYHNAAAAGAGPLSEPTGQTKSTGNADARPNLPSPESTIEPANLQGTINEMPAAVDPSSVPLNAQTEPQEGQIPQTDMGTSIATVITTTLSPTSSAPPSWTLSLTSSLTLATSSLTSSLASAATSSSTSTTRTTLQTTLLPTTTHSSLPTPSAALQTPSDSHSSARMTPALQSCFCSTLTLVNVAEMFKHQRRDTQGFISDRSSSIYSRQPTPFPILSQGELLGSYRAELGRNRAYDAARRVYFALSSVAHMAVDKVKSVPQKQKSAATRRSRESYEYGFSEEYVHIPPPEPAILRGVGKFNPQRPPTGNTSPTWCSTNSPSPCLEEYDRNQPAQQSQAPCEVTEIRDLVEVRSVSSGMVAMTNPADISVDTLTGRISEEKERHQTQHPPEESPPAQGSSEKNNVSEPQLKLVQSAMQREISPVKLLTVQVFRVEMAFVPRNDGHLEVSEGQLVRLEQTFNDGWAWCTLVETGMQGLIPRACLSTWPFKEHRPYTPSSIYSDRGPGSLASLSPTDSQSFRFYQRHSPRASKSGLGSKPPSEK
ncbi:hypothetical protein BDV11DRAFT_210411 [Aspergillus similis]